MLLSQIQGFTPDCWQVEVKLDRIASLRPLWSLPKNSQFRRPMAYGFTARSLEHCDALERRTYIPERESKHAAKWTDKPADDQRCVINNRRRVQRPKSKQFHRQRSELCERTFAYVCDTGAMRRTWLRGLIEVSTRYLMAVAAHNLGQIMRKLFGVGKPRGLQDKAAVAALVSALERVWKRSVSLLTTTTAAALTPPPTSRFLDQTSHYQIA